MIMTTEYYKGYDVLKFILSIFIVAAHTLLLEELPDIHYALMMLISRAIPTFYAISAFLFMSKIDSASSESDKKQILKKSIIRLATIFVIWYIIMLPMTYCRFFETATVKETIYAILLSCTFNGYWFFKSLIINTIILFIFRSKKALKILIVISLLIYIFGAYNYKYSYVNLDISPYYSFYYHLFYFCSGALYSRVRWFKNQKISHMILMLILCVIITCMPKLNPIGRMLYPFILLPIYSKLRFKSLTNNRCKILRTYSILFYVLQFVLIWIYDMACANYIPANTFSIFNNSVVRFATVITALFVISNFLIWLETSKGVKCLKYLH